MELLYEMSRIQKIKSSDLGMLTAIPNPHSIVQLILSWNLAHIDDDFIKMLFAIIEQVSDDVNDPYHYPTIRVLVSFPLRISWQICLTSVTVSS